MTAATEDRMQGLMQDVPLTIEMALRRAETVGAHTAIVSVEPSGIHRGNWGEIAQRARRLRGVLDTIGVTEG
jgi:fatty-acyl-CoA synthase